MGRRRQIVAGALAGAAVAAAVWAGFLDDADRADFVLPIGDFGGGGRGLAHAVQAQVLGVGIARAVAG